MGTIQKIDIDDGKTIEFYSDKMNANVQLSGSMDIVFDHKTLEVLDVVGFEIWAVFSRDSKGIVYCDQMELNTGMDTLGFGPVYAVLKTLLNTTSLEEFAQDNCHYEPPTDGTMEEQIDYRENYNSIYPERPRG